MSNRAKRGGEIGVNGEHYSGGTFLPSTRAPKRATSTSRGSRRWLVEPGVWADAPEGMGAIWQRIRAFAVIENGVARIAEVFDREDHPCWNMYGPRSDAAALIATYNAGGRWTKL